jgi:predicted permease
MPLVRPSDGVSRGPLAQSDRCCVNLSARLASGVSRAAAETELTAIMARLMRPGVDTLVRTVTTHPFTTIGTSGPDANAEIAPVFLMIFAGVAVVLLLACANVANLLLARAASREREIGVRLALGASRARLVRQLMTESLALALVAGIPALAIAQWLPPWIVRLVTSDVTTLRFTPDARVLGVVLLLAVVSCVAFGLAPALHATRARMPQRTRVPLRSVFLSAQVTFCLVLLVAAGLFVRSAQAVRSIDMGFETAGLSEVMMTPSANEDPATVVARLAVSVPALVRESGLTEVAYTQHQPLAVPLSRVRLGTDGHEERILTVIASPEYFAVTRLPLLAGRPYRADDGARSEIVINALLAAELGGPGAAIGRTLVVDSVPRTIVGVTRTARDVGDLRVERRALYVNFDWRSAPRVLVRASDADAQRLGLAVRAMDERMGIAVRSYGWYIDNYFAGATAAAAMAGALGILALVLAAVGIFGVFSFWVRQRQRDIGIRMALGARRGHVLGLVLGASARAMGWGIVLGLAGAVGVATILRSSLYGLSVFDPVTFGAAVGVLLTTALLATALPTWRALHVNPAESLRAD